MTDVFTLTLTAVDDVRFVAAQIDAVTDSATIVDVDAAHNTVDLVANAEAASTVLDLIPFASVHLGPPPSFFPGASQWVSHPNH